jgi:hypothetical protein
MNVIGYQEQIIHQLAPYIGQVDEQQVEMHPKIQRSSQMGASGTGSSPRA